MKQVPNGIAAALISCKKYHTIGQTIDTAPVEGTVSEMRPLVQLKVVKMNPPGFKFLIVEIFNEFPLMMSLALDVRLRLKLSCASQIN